MASWGNVTLSYAAFGLTCKLSLVYRTMSTSWAAAAVALVLVWVTGLVLPFSFTLLLFTTTLHRKEQKFVSCYHFPLNQVHICWTEILLWQSIKLTWTSAQSVQNAINKISILYRVLVQQISAHSIVALILFLVTGVLLFSLAARHSD